MQKGEDFKNFLIIQKLEEERRKATVFDIFLKNKFRIGLSALLLVFIIFLYKIFFSNINVENIRQDDFLFQINNGESIESIAKDLQEKNIITSKFPFKLYMKIFGGDNSAQAGIYSFQEKDSLVSIANKIIRAKYAIPPVRITIPEGSTNEEVAEIINKAFSTEVNKNQIIDDFSKSNILSSLSGSEGFIFPETYFFLPNTYLNIVVTELKNRFYFNLRDLFVSLKENTNKNIEEKIPDTDFLKIYSLDLKDLDIQNFFDEETKVVNLTKRLTVISEIGTTTLSLKDIITMASYLEGEANNEKDMRIVSGALWTRLKLGYPLQIDAATSTYKNKGFTKTPINNPGLIAIKAALNPIKTGYIYYITGNDGNMYYAKDYDTHLDNINKYLRNR